MISVVLAGTKQGYLNPDVDMCLSRESDRIRGSTLEEISVHEAAKWDGQIDANTRRCTSVRLNPLTGGCYR